MDVFAFIPAGCLEGVCNTPLPGYDHSAPYMYPAKFAGVRRRPPQGPSVDAPSLCSFSSSLTAEETADVTQAEDKAADRNRRAAKQ